MKIVKTSIRAPNMNPHCESWISRIKIECLNHFHVFGERHLRYLISEYIEYYNTIRPHRSLDHSPIDYKPPDILEGTPTKIVRRIKLGGVIAWYERVAA